MPQIAAGAQVSREAILADDVVVGPGAIVEGGCTVGGGSSIGAHSILWEGTRLGRGNRVFPFCSLGGEPQDKKYRGEKTALTVGDNNTIREYCFFNRGTVGGGGATKIGDNNWIMGYTHLAHDCVLGGGAIVANGAQFAGHVEVGDGAVIGGGALFHQFLRIGARAMVGGGEAVRQDIPPFAMSARGAVGVNAEGMRRAGFGARARAQIQKAYRILYLAGLSLEESRRQIAEMLDEDSARLQSIKQGGEKVSKAGADVESNSESESESSLSESVDALQTLSDFLSLENLQLIRPRKSARQ